MKMDLLHGDLVHCSLGFTQTPKNSARIFLGDVRKRRCVDHFEDVWQMAMAFGFASQHLELGGRDARADGSLKSELRPSV
jgi:hypothetical protein